MHVLPQQVFKNILQKLLDQLRMIIDDKANSYYIDQFIKNRELLMQLQRSKIDTLKFNEILNSKGYIFFEVPNCPKEYWVKKVKKKAKK